MSVKNTYCKFPPFGDYVLVIAKLNFKSPLPKNKKSFIRNWKNYSVTNLDCELSPYINLCIASQYLYDYSVQDLWNIIENILITSVDKLAPLTVS